MPHLSVNSTYPSDKYIHPGDECTYPGDKCTSPSDECTHHRVRAIVMEWLPNAK